MKKIYALVFSASVLLSACGPDNGSAYVISGNSVEMTLEEAAADISVVALKSQEPVDCSLSEVYGDDIFLIGADLGKMWYFHGDSLVSVLNSQGRGSGEYDYVDRWAYDQKNGKVYVFSNEKLAVLRYDVHTMRYEGMTPLEWQSRDFDLVNDSTFIMIRRMEDGDYGFSLVDIRTGHTIHESDFRMTPNEAQLSYLNSATYSPFKSPIGLADISHRLGWIDENGDFSEVLNFRFEKSVPEKIIRLKGSDEPDDILEYMAFMASEQYCQGVMMPYIADDGYSFWYKNSNPSEDVSSITQLYSKYPERELNVSRLTVPGLAAGITPAGVTTDGRYFTFFIGPSEYYAAPDTEPCELASRIFKALDSQNDDNPVILFYRIR